MRALIFFALVTVFSGPAEVGFTPITRAETIVRLILQEAANEPFAGMVAVAGVVYDRMSDRRWPSSAQGVAYQPHQFPGMDIPLRRYSQTQVTRARMAATEAYSGTRPCGVVYWYHTTGVTPSWRKRLALPCPLGAHFFYGDDK